MQNDEVRRRAIEDAKRQKKHLAEEVLKDVESNQADPVSVFMAGSPGAGKTETVRRVIQRLSEGDKSVVHIDPDEYRRFFFGYNGKNAHLVQAGAVIVAERIHDEAPRRGMHFIFDGTFSALNKAQKNIERSLKRGRAVVVIYVYQDPELAWMFTKSRELVEDRHVRLEDFVTKFNQARVNVDAMKREFEDRIQVDVLVKDFDGGHLAYEQDVDRIDDYLPEPYDEKQLRDKLKE